MKKINKLLSNIILSVLFAFPLALGGAQFNDFQTINGDHSQYIAAEKQGKDKGRGQREGGGKYKRGNQTKELKESTQPQQGKSGRVN